MRNYFKGIHYLANFIQVKKKKTFQTITEKFERPLSAGEYLHVNEPS